MGVLLAAKKKKRAKIFSELFEFNEQLIMNMKFKKYPVEKVAGKFIYIPRILHGENVLGEKDTELISDYIGNLGFSDALSQIDYLNAKRPDLLRIKDESLDEYKKYGSLYIKIFFMIGVLIAVLLV